MTFVFRLDDSNEQIYPACLFNDWGVSKTFLIIYKNEEVELNDQFNFKLSVLVDAENVRYEKNTNDFLSFHSNHFFFSLIDYRFFQSVGYATVYWPILLRKKLYVCFHSMCWSIWDFFFSRCRTDKLATMQQLCSRCYKLYFNPRLGIHIHMPIFFDYFHLSALTMTVHAALLCLLPTYVVDR